MRIKLIGSDSLNDLSPMKLPRLIEVSRMKQSTELTKVKADHNKNKSETD